MEISAANPTALFTGFDVVFQRGFEKPPSYYEQIASVVRSGSRQSTYPWLGRTTKFREWLGDRVVQALEAHTYTIVNKNFEDTVSIDRNDIEDDTYGVYEPIIEQLGWDTKVHPDMLLFSMLSEAVSGPSEVLGYDGQPFFSATHPVGLMNEPGGSTASNVNTSWSGSYWYLIDASRAIRPLHLSAPPRVRGVAHELGNRRGGVQPPRVPLRRRRPRQHRSRALATRIRQQHGLEQSCQLRRGARRDARVQD
jgi:phage major head subunit gpT-like protein